ncbi:hypothetical protein ACFOYW_18285 [Gryllotalpicola reticulitermitis]|uniref:Uncharacterized protein n=1 Tax=Gryllotalpicola reticulitermitis TaxID=1184153 RepID=A0ABV8QCX4_9MICO
MRADIPSDVLAGLQDEHRPLIEDYGSAFKAYLSPPDVDGSSEDLLEIFTEAHVGSYPLDRQHVLEHTTEYTEFRIRIDEVAAEYAFGDGVIEIDTDRIWDLVAENLDDIVELDGKYHLFEK